MKRILLISILILIVSLSYSQTFSIAKLDETPINDNDIITFNNTGDDSNLVTIITNNGSSSIELKLLAETITGTGGSDMEFCFGTCFWGITQGNIYGPVNLDAGVSTGSDEVHFHNHSTENSVISYLFKIYEEGNETNATHFTYKYDESYVGINNVSKSNISIYPNPASDYFTIDINDELIGSQITFTNLLGKVVLKQNMTSSKQTFTTNNFGSGIYFYSIINNNKIVATKKLIIK